MARLRRSHPFRSTTWLHTHLHLQGRRPFLARTLLATALTAAAVVFGASPSSAATEAPAPMPEPRVPAHRLHSSVRAHGGHARLSATSWSAASSRPATWKCELSPVIYIRQPEYWEIEVQGCQRGLGLPVLTPYTVALRLGGTIGTKGVEVVGATRSQRIDVPGRPTELPY